MRAERETSPAPAGLSLFNEDSDIFTALPMHELR